MIEQNWKCLVILRLQQVKEKTGLSTSTIYDRIKNKAFPAQVNLGGSKSVGWLESEIDDWLVARIAERDSSVGAKSGRA